MEEESDNEEPVIPAKRAKVEKKEISKEFKPDEEKDEQALENIMSLFSADPVEC